MVQMKLFCFGKRQWSVRRICLPVQSAQIEKKRTRTRHRRQKRAEDGQWEVEEEGCSILLEEKVGRRDGRREEVIGLRI